MEVQLATNINNPAINLENESHENNQNSYDDEGGSKNISNNESESLKKEKNISEKDEVKKK